MKRLQITSALLLVFLGCFQVLMAQTKPDDIVGLWFTEDKDAKIKIYPQDGKYFGKIVWHKTGPEISPYDENNPDEELRKQKKIGLVMLRDFEYDDGEWEDGKIYDPKSGKTYSCVMKLNDDGSLYVRGYIGVSFIGRTTNWTRAD